MDHPTGRQNKLQDVYHRSIISKKVILNINNIGGNLKEIIEKKISYDIEGKCITEGYIKPRSVAIINYSSGRITNGTNIIFDAVFECDVCLPVEGMKVECIAKNITKAGIRAEINVSADENETSPVVIFIARDHHIENKYYNDISENDTISVRVIGQRFELNDKYITIIAELLGPTKKYNTNYNKPSQKVSLVK